MLLAEYATRSEWVEHDKIGRVCFIEASGLFCSFHIWYDTAGHNFLRNLPDKEDLLAPLERTIAHAL